MFVADELLIMMILLSERKYRYKMVSIQDPMSENKFACCNRNAISIPFVVRLMVVTIGGILRRFWKA